MVVYWVKQTVFTNYGVIFALKNVNTKVEVEFEVEVDEKCCSMQKVSQATRSWSFSSLWEAYSVSKKGEIFFSGYLNMCVKPYKKTVWTHLS